MDRIDAMLASRRLSPVARKHVDRRLLEADMHRDDPLAVLVVLEVSIEEKIAVLQSLPPAIAQLLEKATQRHAVAHAEAVVAGVQTRLAPALEAMGRRTVLLAGRRTALGLVVGALLCFGAGMLIAEERLLARQVPLSETLAVQPEADSWAALIAANPFSLDALLERHCGEGSAQFWVSPTGERGCSMPLWMPDTHVLPPQNLPAQLWRAAESRMARAPGTVIALVALALGLVAGLAGRASLGWVARCVQRHCP